MSRLWGLIRALNTVTGYLLLSAILVATGFGFFILFFVVPVGHELEVPSVILAFGALGLGIIAFFAALISLVFNLIGRLRSPSTVYTINLSDTSQSDSPPNELNLVIEHLSRNFNWYRTEARLAFLFSVFSLFIGLLVIVMGILIILNVISHVPFLTQRMNQPVEISDLTAYMSFIAGSILELIAGGTLVLFRWTSKRLNEISTNLLETWKILEAFNFAEDLPENDRTEMRKDLIKKLVVTAY